MNLDRQHFVDLYASLPDERLIEVAISSQLTSIAGECIETELTKRGITDLSRFKEARDAQAEKLEKEDKAIEAKVKRSTTFVDRVRNVGCVMMVMLGLFLALSSGAENAVELGIGIAAVGILALLFFWLIIRLKVARLTRLFYTLRRR